MLWDTLKNLFLGLCYFITKKRDDDHIAQGRAEQSVTDQQATIDAMNREARARANAPDSDAEIERRLREGKL